MQDVGGDVGPEFTEDICQGIASDGICVFLADRSGGSSSARIVTERNTLRHSSAQQFRNVEAVVAVVVRGDEDASSGIKEAPPERAFAHSVIALVLMKDGGHGEDDEIVPDSFVGETAPVISAVSGHAFAKLRMSVGPFRHGGSDSDKDERGVVETISRGDDEGLLRAGWRRQCSGTDRAEIRHDTEDSFWLLFRCWCALVRRNGLGRLRRGLHGISCGARNWGILRIGLRRGIGVRIRCGGLLAIAFV